MKCSFTILLIGFLLIVHNSNAQSFEGILTYKVDYEFNSKMTRKIKDKVFSKLKEKGEYYDTVFVVLKQGNYAKFDNALRSKKIIYTANNNKLYFFQKSSSYVMITKANIHFPLNINLPEPIIVIDKVIKNIGNYKCKTLHLKWNGVGEELYYFNPKVLPINPNLFANHNYEYLNRVLELTRAYPIKISKKMNNLMTINLTLIETNESTISNEYFRIPSLEKANQELSESTKEITGYEIWVIK